MSTAPSGQQPVPDVGSDVRLSAAGAIAHPGLGGTELERATVGSVRLKLLEGGGPSARERAPGLCAIEQQPIRCKSCFGSAIGG